MAIILLALGCGGPQKQDEAAITYRLKFSAAQAVNTRVIFPLPQEPAVLDALKKGVTVADGGTLSYVEGMEGPGAALDGLGAAEASFTAKAVKGVEGGSAAPLVSLSMSQPDGGPADLYVRVNKSGAAAVNIEFEFTAAKNCGNGCGGKRSWKFSGPVGLALQTIRTDYVEEN